MSGLLSAPGAVAALSLVALAAEEPSLFPADRDPGGCRLERVAVEDGARSYQYASFSADGLRLAVGWDRGEDTRGTYLLDLLTGDREEVPEFNNGATFSPDGETLLNSIYVDNGKTDIVELDLATRELRVLAPHEAWDWLPSYSPDGSSVVFNSYRSGNSDIYLYDRASGDLRRLTDSDAYEAHAQFSPDGTRVVFHRQDGETDYNLYVVDLASGAERRLTSSPREESYPSWTADGRHILFSSDRDNEVGKTDIFVMSVSGERVRRLTRHPEKDGYAFGSPDGEHVYFTSYREPQGVYRMKVNDDLTCVASE